MAFPQVAGTLTTSETTDVSSHNVSMSGTASQNDILLIASSIDGGPDITPPTNYSVLVEDHTSGTNFSFVIFWKRANGGEGNTTFGTSSLEKSVSRSWRITGTHTSTDPAISTVGAATDFNPNPPSLSPSWGTEDTLWLAICAAANGGTGFTGYPANFTNGVTENSGGTSDGVAIGTARREIAAASQDPGTFTIDASRAWRAVTVAIRPAAPVIANKSYVGLVGIG